MNITIYGEPRTKKNSMRVVRYGSRLAIRPSKAYEAYEKEFIKQIDGLGLNSLSDARRMNIACIYYMKTKRKVDLLNLLSGTLDALVSSGVIEDDNKDIAHSHDGSRVRYDKENPRVEIFFTEVEENY